MKGIHSESHVPGDSRHNKQEFCCFSNEDIHARNKLKQWYLAVRHKTYKQLAKFCALVILEYIPPPCSPTVEQSNFLSVTS